MAPPRILHPLFLIIFRLGVTYDQKWGENQRIVRRDRIRVANSLFTDNL